MEAAYQRNLSDEFVEPAVIETAGAIKDGDALIFCDFREDSIRQIAEAFIDQGFARFPVKKFANLYIATMTRYRENSPFRSLSRRKRWAILSAKFFPTPAKAS